MKILRIAAQNLASFKEFEIDYTKAPLQGVGLYAITGSTGAGKSTILDALCIALYHEAPRLQGVKNEADFDTVNGTISQSSIEQLIRKGALSCLAAVDFVGSTGQSYRAEWGYNISKRSKKPQSFCSLYSLTENRLLCDKVSEKLKWIKELVGMDFAHFTKTTLLAQGGFAAFLKANQDERSKILEELTGETIYARISMRVQKQFSEAKSERDLLSKQLDSSAQNQLSDSELQALQNEQLEKHSQKEILQKEHQALSQFQIYHKDLLLLNGNLNQIQIDIQQKTQEQNIAQNLLHTAQQEKIKVDEIHQNLLVEINQAEALDKQIIIANNELTLLQKSTAKYTSELSTLKQQIDLLSKNIQNTTQRKDLLCKEQDEQKNISHVIEKWELIKVLLQQAQQNSQKAIELQNALEKKKSDLQSATALFMSIIEQQKALAIPQDLTINALENNTVELLLRKQQLELDNDLQELLKKIDESTQQINSTQVLIQSLKPQIASLNQIKQNALVHLEATEQLRKQLKPGCECPVCGSQEHPWATQQFTLQVHDQQKEVLQQLDTQISELDTQLLNAEKAHHNQVAFIELNNNEILKLKNKCNNLIIQDATIQQLTLPQVQESLIQNTHYKNALNKQSELDKLKVQAQHNQEILNSEISQIQAQISTIQEQQLSEIQVLHNYFLDLPWHEYWSKNAQAFIEKLNTRVLEFKKRAQAIIDLDSEIQNTNAKHNSAIDQSKMIEGVLVEQQNTLAEKQSILDALQIERKKLLQGQTTESILHKIQIEKQQVTENIARYETANSSLVARLAQLQGSQQEQLKRYQNTLQEFNILGNTLTCLSPFTTSIVDSFTNTAMQFDFSNQELIITISNQLQTCKEALDFAFNRYSEIHSRIQMHHEMQSKLQEDLLLLENKSRRVEQLSELNDLIGSSDGKKFRILAQQITLDSLLYYANIHLAHIAPRYALIRQTSTLTIGVQDAQFGEDLRPVHTLSGGESFIASLCLALALADIHQGSSINETLFIDEGFGTLDPETLRLVMNALMRLQQQGRCIGVITHVEEMKQAITTLIEVKKGALTITVN